MATTEQIISTIEIQGGEVLTIKDTPRYPSSSYGNITVTNSSNKILVSLVYEMTPVQTPSSFSPTPPYVSLEEHAACLKAALDYCNNYKSDYEVNRAILVNAIKQSGDLQSIIDEISNPTDIGGI